MSPSQDPKSGPNFQFPGESSAPRGHAMARIKRQGPKRLCRRSREARRLSEGGGWVAPPSTTEPGPEALQQQQQQKVNTGELTEEEIDSACLFVFKFDEIHKELMIKDDHLQMDLEDLCELKVLYDAKMASLKKATKSPDSQKLKQIKFAARESLELGELIDDCKMSLFEVNLLKTKAEAILRSHESVLTQYAEREEQGCMIGYLARIMKME